FWGGVNKSMYICTRNQLYLIIDIMEIKLFKLNTLLAEWLCSEAIHVIAIGQTKVASLLFIVNNQILIGERVAFLNNQTQTHHE
ncbi:MAG: hypothetical protein NC113_09090, partial [Bacteroides sp.]|nr:hypothetical protein [Bacteroides sp.]MCM1448349.1 hypothetical protein [Bacteroides sp.]